MPLAKLWGPEIRHLEREKTYPSIFDGEVSALECRLLLASFPLEVFRLVLAQGERLEMRSHPQLFILQFYSKKKPKKKNNMGEFSRFRPIHNNF